jgi:flagellar basal body-associated protein FliL
MKIFSKIMLFIFVLIGSFQAIQAWFLSDLLDNGKPHVNYCQNDDCGWEEWVTQVWDNLEGVVTNQTASQYIQEIIIFLIGFLSLLAVIYIIYAWFNIMIWSWDEEKMKKSKSTIIYVILGLLIIYFAYTLVAFVFNVFDSNDSQVTLITQSYIT